MVGGDNAAMHCDQRVIADPHPAVAVDYRVGADKYMPPQLNSPGPGFQQCTGLDAAAVASDDAAAMASEAGGQRDTRTEDDIATQGYAFSSVPETAERLHEGLAKMVQHSGNQLQVIFCDISGAG